MLVVSDTSPLTALLQIGQAELLQRLFDEVFIPPAVGTELLRSHTKLPDWLRVRAPREIPEFITSARLDRGETAALALPLDLHADAILIDERLGRRVARELGLKATGLLGCLVLAKEARIIEAVAPVVSDLQNIAGCWFDEELIASIYRAAGESRK